MWKERDTPASPLTTRALWAAVAASALALVVFASFALPEVKNPLATFDWNVFPVAGAKDVREAPDILFQSSSSSAPSACGISPTLLSEFGGKHNFRLSQVHLGSGYRMQRVLAKAARGEKIRVAVLGGSVSLGHGTDPKTGQRNKYGAVPVEEQWHQYVRRYFEEIAGVAPEFVLGAKAATDSSFFEWCWATLIGTEVDLVLVEMAVNDEFSSGMDSSENLLRSLLQLDTKPAVIYADTFALRSGAAQATLLNGQDLQNSLASYYDVPQISARPALLPAMIRHPELKKPLFLGDVRHGSAKLHRFLGSMIVGYLQEERCRGEEAAWWADEGKKERRVRQEKRQDGEGEGEVEAFEWPGTEGLGEVPRVKMNEGWDANVSHATEPPTCSLAGVDLKPVNESKDWVLFNWKYSKYYYETTIANSEEVVFEGEVREGAQGRLAVSFLRSRQYNLGKARCTVGTQNAVLDGYWGSSTSVAQTTVVAKGLPPGRHRVSCRTLPVQKGDTGTAFRIMGVMTI
ncbi:hypothetical protein JCM6882_006442 [Rhodosporidiobolus microsporus]